MSEFFGLGERGGSLTPFHGGKTEMLCVFEQEWDLHFLAFFWRWCSHLLGKWNPSKCWKELHLHRQAQATDGTLPRTFQVWCVAVFLPGWGWGGIGKGPGGLHMAVYDGYNPCQETPTWNLQPLFLSVLAPLFGNGLENKAEAGIPNSSL